ncbi:MAG TPA: tetratricopeptide repeat protein [Chthoniobacterales bacterium]|jgi:tetratricopeptide (TPR) repeat protein|nr:tetratricopeptide repeat protein [Chthoniobacterales bacterium]
MSIRNWLFGLILFVATTLAYKPAWHGGLIWDDDLYLKSGKSSSLIEIWAHPRTTQQYHPLVGTVFWIENKLWDDSMLGYHLVNILLHACSALLLFKILERLEIPGAWLAAAVFALHPVQVESVAWLVELKNTLSGFLFFSAVIVYLRFDQSRDKVLYAAALFLFVIGLLAKTIVAVFPLAILIIIWCKCGRIDWKRDFFSLAPFFLVAASAGILTAWMEQNFAAGQHEIFDYSLPERILIAGRLFWFYLGKFFWPADLIMIYPAWTLTSSDWGQYLFPIGAIALFGVLWLARKKSRAPFAGLLYFTLTLFPMLGFFNQSYYMGDLGQHSAIFRADHFQYLAIVGIVAPLAAGAEMSWERIRGFLRHIIAVAAAGLVLFLASLTWAQSRNYQNAETCFRAVLLKNPRSATAHNNLAGALMDRGATEEAIVHFRKALELEPDYEFANYNLGAALVQHGDLGEAILRLKSVLRENPNDPRAYYTLANALSKRGDQDEAIAYYGRALRLAPDFSDAHTNLANLMLEKGDTSGALEHYREALRLQPNSPQAHYNFAVGLVQNGEPDAAIPELRTTLQLDPEYPDAEPLLRDLLARKQR